MTARRIFDATWRGSPSENEAAHALVARGRRKAVLILLGAYDVALESYCLGGAWSDWDAEAWLSETQGSLRLRNTSWALRIGNGEEAALVATQP